MSFHFRRIQAIHAVVAGSVVSRSVSYAKIRDEFSEVAKDGRIVNRNRRFLLQVLHSTRALDTSLAELINQYGIINNARSLGAYLKVFSSTSFGALGHARLPSAKVTYYQNAIVNKRNQYMHSAGAVPANNDEIRILLSEMQACLFEIFAL
jgi:hypothetical protein